MSRFKLEFKGEADEDYQEMIDLAEGKLNEKLNQQSLDKLSGVTVKIAPGITSGGGETKVRENLILLNSTTMQMSLQQSEDLLVRAGYFNPGERTKVLPDTKDRPWSTIVYELIHEAGHILGGNLDVELSPTKYGRRAEHEAFCEAFTYWVLGQPITAEAEQAMINLGKRSEQ